MVWEAPAMSVPQLKPSTTSLTPARERLSSVTSPSRVASASSTGREIWASTSWGAAPSKVVRTVIVGYEMSGISSTDSRW